MANSNRSSRRSPLARVLAVAVLSTALSTLFIVEAPSAFAQNTCTQSDFGISHFAGYGAYNANGNDGSPYRGITGNITTRLGYSCDPPSPVPGWYLADRNFTTAWLMTAAPDGIHGFAQAGFFRFNGGSITTFAETNANGSGPTRRVYPAIDQAGNDHRYTADYQAGCACVALYIDGVLALGTDFNPISAWGSGQWALESYGETKDFQSDIPGHFGASTFFHALGSKTSTQYYTGTLGLNFAHNDYSTRWAVGAINEFDPAVYGINFQTYTY